MSDKFVPGMFAGAFCYFCGQVAGTLVTAFLKAHGFHW